MSITHSDKKIPYNREDDYRAGYEAGLKAKEEHPLWTQEDAHREAGEYSAYFLMNDKAALQRWEGFYAGATGAPKRY